MPSDFLSNLYVFILAGFVGFEIIKRVSPLLHTPLMSLTNALDAIVVSRRHHHRRDGMRRRLSTILGRSPWPPPSATWSAVSSSPIACCACSRPARAEKVMNRHRYAATHRLRLYRRHRSLHSVDQVAKFARQRRGAACWRAKLARRWPWAPRSPIPELVAIQVDHHRARLSARASAFPLAWSR